jgi:hypothetical protein
MKQNFTPLPSRFIDEGSSLSLAHIAGSFIIFFLVGASVLAVVFFSLKKKVSNPSPYVNSPSVSPTIVSIQEGVTLISPTLVPTPTTGITEKEIKDAGLPETISIGSIEAELSDLQKDLNNL